MNRKPSKLQQLWEITQEILDERVLDAQSHFTRTHRFAHFWIMVWKSFSRNRCPARASALSYTSLLALVPMLAVAIGITSSFFKSEDGERRINDLIVSFVASVTPPDLLKTNAVIAQTNLTVMVTSVTEPSASERTNAGALPLVADTNVTQVTQTVTGTNQAVLPEFLQREDAVRARKEIVRRINEYVKNTQSGALGITGSVLLIFVAISMLSRVEVTFNDIWGVARGRSWHMRVVLYWGVITLVPVLLVLALALGKGPQLAGPRHLLESMPIFGNLLFKIIPALVVCLTFSLFYLLMPNTRVDWRAALVGGVLASALFHLNNAVSALYVSRVVTYSKVYGSLGLVPVFMVGLYLSWLILLLGAQVAYAYQNRATYLEERQVEAINQRGREFVALRLVTRVAELFAAGERPPTVCELAEQLAVPSRLITQIMPTLGAARLVLEVTGSETAFVPARPLHLITCHDVLQAMRSCSGHELATRDEPARAEVLGEFTRIQEAERQAAGSVTLLDMARRAQTPSKHLTEPPTTPTG